MGHGYLLNKREEDMMSKILKLMISIFLGMICMAAFASPYYTPETPVHVNGYTRSNGTHVDSYYRAEPGQGQLS